MPSDVTVEFSRIRFVRDGQVILDDIDWTIAKGDRWVIVGPNGSGKTSLCRIAGLYNHPSSGSLSILGHRLGRTDIRALRTRLGISSQLLADKIQPGLRASEVVMTGKYATLAACWHDYTDADSAKAIALLSRFHCGGLAHAKFGNLSTGERQRVLLARALFNDPELLILDEPTAGLDLAGRERLVSMLSKVAHDELATIVLVTHHVDEIPPNFTHILMISDGKIVAQGALHSTLTSNRLSACFGIDLCVKNEANRWAAWGTGSVS